MNVLIRLKSDRIGVGENYTDPASRIWRMLVDTQKWPRWGPTVKNVDSTQRFIQLGSSGRVQTLAGIWLPYKIVRLEEESFWSWRVGGVKATGHQVLARPEGGSTLWFDVPIWAAPYTLVCQVALKRIGLLL